MPPTSLPEGLTPEEMLPQEVVLHHWKAHHQHDRGVLTDRRLLLLSPLHPISLRREVSWQKALEEVHAVEVTRMGPVDAPYGTVTSMGGVAPMGTAGVSGGAAAFGGATSTTLSGDFLVRVDDTIVFSGKPQLAAELRDRIDQAAVNRRVALGQRL